MSLERPKAKLSIEEVENGLLISQAGNRYLAREWTLCPDVVKAIGSWSMK